MESKLNYSMSGLGDPQMMSPSPAMHQQSAANSAIQYFTSKYIRHSRAVAILWGVFTVCTAILNIVVFASEQWVGDTSESKGPGHFGLWKFCTVLSSSTAASEASGGSSSSDSGSSSASGAGGILVTKEEEIICLGDLNDFASILSPAFRAATIFVGLSVIVAALCVLSFILFCFMKAQSVFEICGTMQLLAAVCLAVGILCFPAGWDDDHVRGICGENSDDFVLGTCGIRWSFILAVLLFFDLIILCCLAFTLSRRDVKPQPIMENHYMNPASIYKGEMNGGFIGDSQSLSGSRKSLAMQKVMMAPHYGSSPMHPGHPEESFPYGGRGPTPGGGGGPPGPPGPPGYPPNIQNFQL